MKKFSTVFHVRYQAVKHHRLYHSHLFLGDEVTTFEQLRDFQSVLPLSLTDPILAQQKLKKIQVKVQNNLSI